MKKLVNLLFSARTAGHAAHLATSSYAQHMALGSFYSEVGDFADSLTEMWQGWKGVKLNPSAATPEFNGDIIALLRQHVQWIQQNRNTETENYSPLQNEVDSVLALYHSTIYKLTMLA